MEYLNFFVTHNVLLTAILAFGLGLWVYFDRRDDARNTTLGSLLVAVALWSFAFVLWRMTTEPDQALFWIRTIYFIGSVLPVLFVLFATTLFIEKLPRLIYQVLLMLPNVVLLYFTYFTNLLVVPTGTLIPNFGSARVIFAIHFALYLIAGLGLLLLAARRNTKLDRNKLASVLVGTIIAFDSIYAVLFGTNKLTANADSFWVGNIALLAGMFVIAVSVIHRRLLVDLRLVSVEIFILLTLFVILADVVVSQNLLDFTLRLAILVVLVLYGALISRNMVKEVRHLRELQALTEHVTKINGRLLEADRTKTQFVSLASHQFRAPLGGMRSYLDMLFKGDFGPLTPKQKEIIGLNMGVVNQLLQTIETFLNITKIELGAMELYKTETRLQQLIPRVVESMLPIASRKKLVIDTEISPYLRATNCDAGKIYHVISNLIDNSIKYTETGRILVSAAQENDRVVVRVKDTGVGLSAEEQESLFKSFKRGLSGVQLNTDGSGLGLFLVKNIIEAHGGEVFVQSLGRGHGSVFGFSLPMPTA